MRKRNKTIAIRCTEDERDKIRERADSHSMSLSDFVLRSELGKKNIVVSGLDEVIRQMKAIGNNLNQLARLANQGEINVIDLRKFIDEYRSASSLGR